MKRLSPEELEWAIRHQRKVETKRDRRRKRRGRTKSRQVIASNPYFISVPSTFCLYDRQNCEQSLRFIQHVESLAQESTRRLTLDFRQCKRATAAAILCLHGRLAVIKMMNNREQPARFIANAGTPVGTILNATGFLKDSTDFPHGEELIARMLPIRTGVSGAHAIPQLIKDMDVAFYSGELDEDLTKKSLLKKSISEAMLNVSHHAYQDASAAFLAAVGKRWWLVGTQFGEQLYFVFYDMGVGIPNTLPKHSHWEQIQMTFHALVGHGHDSAMIKAATEIGRSKFQIGGHGWGLRDVMNFAAENPEGTLWIFSSHGLYKYESTTHSESLQEHKGNVKGTLIQWNVSLKQYGVQQ